MLATQQQSFVDNDLEQPSVDTGVYGLVFGATTDDNQSTSGEDVPSEESTEEKCIVSFDISSSEEGCDQQGDESYEAMQELLDKLLVCALCKKKGHFTQECNAFEVYMYCENCGDLKQDHKCPMDRCLHCGSWDHQETCIVPSNTPSTACTRCETMGHAAALCPDRWRQYRFTVTHRSPRPCPASEQRPRDPSCYNCGRSGHYGDKCSYYPDNKEGLLSEAQSAGPFGVVTYDADTSALARDWRKRKVVSNSSNVGSDGDGNTSNGTSTYYNGFSDTIASDSSAKGCSKKLRPKAGSNGEDVWPPLPRARSKSLDLSYENPDKENDGSEVDSTKNTSPPPLIMRRSMEDILGSEQKWAWSSKPLHSSQPNLAKSCPQNRGGSSGNEQRIGSYTCQVNGDGGKNYTKNSRSRNDHSHVYPGVRNHHDHKPDYYGFPPAPGLYPYCQAGYINGQHPAGYVKKPRTGFPETRYSIALSYGSLCATTVPPTWRYQEGRDDLRWTTPTNSTPTTMKRPNVVATMPVKVVPPRIRGKPSPPPHDRSAKQSGESTARHADQAPYRSHGYKPQKAKLNDFISLEKPKKQRRKKKKKKSVAVELYDEPAAL